MERLDQGHLHPLLEHPGLAGGEYSSKELFEQRKLLLSEPLQVRYIKK
jgi:hypothetical protein